MKKQFAFLSILSFMLLTVQIACKKSSSNSTPPKTNTQLLTQASWKFQSASISGSDITSSLPTCQKDNTMKFNTDGSGVLDEGATKCNSSDPQTTNYTWSFQSSETIIHASVVLFTGATTNDFTVNTLSETSLVVQFTYTNGIGPVQTVVATFVH